MSGIWLEIANVRYETAKKGSGVQVQFKHDRADGGPVWWQRSCGTGKQEEEMLKEHDRLIRALDGKRSVVGQLGCVPRRADPSAPGRTSDDQEQTEPAKDGDRDELEVVAVRIQFTDSSVR